MLKASLKRTISHGNLKKPVALLLTLLLAAQMFTAGLPGMKLDKLMTVYSANESEAPALTGSVYTVSNAQHLVWISEQVDTGNSFSGYTIELANDIDLSDITWKGIGYNFNHYFSGIFNGNSHVIKNANVSVSFNSGSIINAPRHTVGLFGFCNGATVKKLKVECCQFSILGDSGYQNDYSSINGTSVYSGSVCGYAVNSVFNNITVNNCTVSATTGAESGAPYGGGIVGYADACNFAHCVNNGGSVTGSTQSIIAGAYAGGLIGELNGEGTVRQCSNTASVSGGNQYATDYIGGIIGKSTSNTTTLSSIRDCYNRGNLNHEGSWLESGCVGGIVGYSSSAINRCYNSGTVIASTNTVGGTVSVAGIAGDGIESSSVSNCAVMAQKINGGTLNTLIAKGSKKENNIASTRASATNDATTRFSADKFYGSDLYVTLLDWDFGQIWCSYPTDYPDLVDADVDNEGNITSVMERINGITIQFAEGDYFNHVTQNVTFVSGSGDESVGWHSDKENIVSSETGVVTRQEETYEVKISAVVSKGGYSLTKSFILVVLGSNETFEYADREGFMSKDEAKSLLAWINHCKVKDIKDDNPDLRVLIGEDVSEESVASTMAKILAFWQVPGESELIRSKMGDLIGYIKSGQDTVTADLIGDASEGLVKWNSDNQNAEVNIATIASNFCKIAKTTFDIRTNYIDNIKTIKKAVKLGMDAASPSTEADPLISVLSRGEKVCKFIDHVASWGGEGELAVKLGPIASNIKKGAQWGRIIDAYGIQRENAAKGYLNTYLQLRPQYDSPDDSTFQLLLDAKALSGSGFGGLSQDEINDLKQTAEAMYTLDRLFNQGLEDEYKVSIKCPVDVQVYDQSGRLVGRTVNNQVDYSVDGFLLIEIGGKNNDEKIITIPDSDEYSIILTGTNSGQMNIEIEYYDNSQLKVFKNSNISLTSGKQMLLDVSSSKLRMMEQPRVYLVNEWVESDMTEGVESVDVGKKVCFYPYIQDADGSVYLSIIGGYCDAEYIGANDNLTDRIKTNDGYQLIGLFKDAQFNQAYDGNNTEDDVIEIHAVFSPVFRDIVITGQPQSAEYQTDDTAQPLTVDVESDGEVNFQWYRFDDIKENAVAIEGATENTYTPDTTEVGEASYFVRVSNYYGTEVHYVDSESAQISVRERTNWGSGTCGNNVSWTIHTDGTLRIYGSGKMTDYAESDAPWYLNRDKITAVVIEDGVTSVGNNAFSNLTRLEEITVPDSVQSVGTGVLTGCVSLESLTVPFIGSKRTASETDDAVLGYLFGRTNSEGVVQYYKQSGDSLSGYRYAIPSSLNKVVVTDATLIPFGAFCNCSNLTTVELNEGITVIQSQAFADCTGLSILTIPKSVTEISQGALEGCNSLKKLSVPFVGASRTSNGTAESVFGHIFGFGGQSDTNYYVQYYAKNGTQLSGYGYAVPTSLEEISITDASQIPLGAFSNLSQMKILTLNAGIINMDLYSFYGTSELTDIYYQDTEAKWNAIEKNNCQLSDDVTVHFVDQTVHAQSVTLNSSSIQMFVGDTVELTAVVTPDNAVDILEWTSSDESVATVEGGVVTAVNAGIATITAKAGDVSATCLIMVSNTPTSMTLNKESMVLQLGDSESLSLTVVPISLNSPVWTSSDESVAAVENGTVTAIGIGTATITAIIGDRSVTCEVTVVPKEVPATEITLSNTTLNLQKGDTATLTATVTPENSTDAVKWSSSNETVATVANGTVTAKGIGTATITAKAGSKTATCEITVVPKEIPATAIKLSSTTLNLQKDDTVTLTATVTPENSTDAVEWSSSDESVATVANGTVTAKDVGTATITAKAGSKTATCEVTVVPKEVPATAITLSDTTFNLQKGDTATLTATVTPDNSTDTVEWSSSDETVVTVANGTVTAKGFGTATITAKAGSKTATCEVTVVPKEIPATAITLSDTTLNLQKGNTATLTATVTPENSTDAVEWSSSDESVATIANGVVTAKGIGTATITAKAGSKTATCEVTVVPKEIPATAITLSNTTLNLQKGDTATLTATVTPDNSTDAVEWSSSDETIATVANGTVTAVGKGSANITVTAGNVSAVCSVTVTEVTPESYDVSPNVNGGASKLFEPWGLKYFATFDGDGRAHISDRGIAILKDTYYSDGMTPEAFCANENANVFLGSKGELEYENPTDKYPNGRYAATLTKGIYSYDISAKYYVVPFVVMDNGQTVYGTIKSNSMERILTNNLKSTTVSDTEKAISRCILELKESVAEYYAEMEIPSASHDMVIPRGNTQTAAPLVKTVAQSGITPNVVAGAARLIEPWGMRYYATYTASDEIADRGVVMLSQQSYNSVYSSSPDSMRLNKNAFVFRESDGTLVYDSNMARYSATVTEGISSKDISDLYYVVPFVVLNDGSYVYGNVKSNSMKNILTRNQDKDNVPDTEKAVSRDIIALYEAVKAYYEE